MEKKQLIYFFLSNFIVYITGMGLFPILPIYAGDQFGATAAMVGFYMALIYIAITAGSLAVGWIPPNVSRKLLFVIVGTIGAPAILLLGQATAFWQLVILTSIVWFSGGFATSMIGLFTGLIAEEGGRGRSFSIMFLARPMAGIFGGVLVTWLLSWGTYRPTFITLSAIWIIMPIIGLISLPDLRNQKITKAQRHRVPESAPVAGSGKIQMGWQFYILMVMLLLATTAAYSARLGISLSLIELDFDAAAAASIAIASSLFTLPVVLLIGSLSDRLGRYRFLTVGSLMTTAGSVILLLATQLWQFWLAGGLLLASMTVTATVASAMGTDLLSGQALGRGLPWLNAMTWLAGVVGFSGAGLVVESWGTSALYLGAFIISILATMLVVELRPQPLFVPAAAARTPAPRPFDQCLDEATEFTTPCSEMA